MKKPRILIIDDNPLMVTVVELMLANKGIDIVAASTGAEGLAAIERKRPDLILMEMTLADTDCEALIKRIRETRALTTIKIVAVTSSDAIDGNAEVWRTLGFDGCLLKPFNVTAAISQIRELLSCPNPSS